MGEAPARPGVAGAHTSSLWLSLGGKAPASLLCFCGTGETQPGREPGSACPPPPGWRCPLTVQDVELVCSVAEAWGQRQGSGVAGAGPGARADHWETLTVLGEEQDVVLGQVGPLDPLLKDTQG